MIEAFNSFCDVYWKTIVVFVVSAACIGCLVELYKQSLFAKIEDKYKEDKDKLAKVKTLKGGTAFALAALLTAFFLACIWKSELPKIGNAAILPVWYTALFVLQMFIDIKGVKNLLGRVLGNVVKSTEPKEPKEEKPKLKKKKVTSYVYYDKDGNVVTNPENA